MVGAGDEERQGGRGGIARGPPVRDCRGRGPGVRGGDGALQRDPGRGGGRGTPQGLAGAERGLLGRRLRLGEKPGDLGPVARVEGWAPRWHGRGRPRETEEGYTQG